MVSLLLKKFSNGIYNLWNTFGYKLEITQNTPSLHQEKNQTEYFKRYVVLRQSCRCYVIIYLQSRQQCNLAGSFSKIKQFLEQIHYSFFLLSSKIIYTQTFNIQLIRAQSIYYKLNNTIRLETVMYASASNLAAANRYIDRYACPLPIARISVQILSKYISSYYITFF